ncbi:MAG: endonuclease domain-containing protein [Prevotella sp.]|nr:endonuclease domain-containing protein [Prevotella sp.]
MGYDYQTADPTLYGLLKDLAKNNRSHPTEAESILWDCLKGKSLGVPFKRQHIIGEFIADFVCIPEKLIIEVDGGYHQLPEQQTNDEERQQWLEYQGFTVLRFTNEEVIGNINGVLETIENHILK